MPYCHECGAEVEASANYCPQCGTAQGETATRADPRRSAVSRSSLAGRTWTNALIGGTVGFVIALFAATIVVPLYVLGIMGGAALAGYLHERGETAGAKVGLLSGLIATAPVLLLIILGAVIGFGGLAAGMLGHLGPHDMAGFTAVAVLSMFAVTLSFLVNLIFGALGGFVGGALVDQ